jgi:hypothetical protein
MDDQWPKLSREEKRRQRHEWMLNPGVQFVSAEAEKAFKLRTQRLLDVYMVEEPDRVPVTLPVGALPAYLNGIDYRTAMYDYEKAAEGWTKFNEEFEMDEYVSPAMVLPGRVYEMLGYKLYSWPGHGLPNTATGFQYNEGEYMLADEYDALINDPSSYLARVYSPRVFGALGSLGMLPSPIGLTELPSLALMPFAMPPLQNALQTLINVGKELATWGAFAFQFAQRGIALGFPRSMLGTLVKAPFDYLGDTLRGTKGIMMDMYRRPDEVLEAVDVLADMTIAYAISNVNATRSLMAVFPLHKGADGWMSDRQFETFYWPSLKKIINALINEGILVSLFAEGSFNTRLESVNEFPKGAVHWMFDRSDMARAKTILGNRCSISGNVPASLLVAGTPREVKEYCRNLIEVCGKGGGYLLACGTAGVDESKPENLRAMMEAAKEYGVYKK